MVLLGRHVRYVLHRFVTSTPTAYSPGEIYSQTTMPALIRANLQHITANVPVKPHPIELLKRTMQFANNRRHQRDQICLAFTKQIERLEVIEEEGRR